MLLRILKASAFAVIGLALAAIALAILPLYGAFMVLWLHVPLGDILLTLGPFTLALGIGAFVSLRASVRAFKGHAGNLGDLGNQHAHP